MRIGIAICGTARTAPAVVPVSPLNWARPFELSRPTPSRGERTHDRH